MVQMKVISIKTSICVQDYKFKKGFNEGFKDDFIE